MTINKMLKREVIVHGKVFEEYISEQQIQEAVRRIAIDINQRFKRKQPIFIGVLKGAFMFFSDLMKEVNIECEVAFVKLMSYEGMESTGRVKEIIGIQQDLKDRVVILIEDIIDSGHTIKFLIDKVSQQKPAELVVASFLIKPDALKHEVDADYIGFQIPNDFVVGYGLDYDGIGRNIKRVYKLKTLK